MTIYTQPVLVDVAFERHKQNSKWGEQNHPNGTSPIFKSMADASREACEVSAQAGTLTWRSILLEEVTEAFAESDPKLLREELVQVCAVAVAWIEKLDRERRAKK